MADENTRNVPLTIAAILLFVGAAVNLVSGAQTIIDRPNVIEQGAVPAAVTYWALSSLSFGVIQAIGAALLLQRRREGAAVAYTMIVLAAVYWVASISVQTAFAVAALLVLAATAILIFTNRDALD